MLQAIYDFLYGAISSNITGGGALYIFMSRQVTIFDYSFPLSAYLSFIGALIFFVFILVLCCLFVYKIIKLIGGLMR